MARHRSWRHDTGLPFGRTTYILVPLRVSCPSGRNWGSRSGSRTRACHFVDRPTVRGREAIFVRRGDELYEREECIVLVLMPISAGRRNDAQN